MSRYIVKSESVKFKVSHVTYAYALIAAVAASATFTVHANTTRNWIGGTGTADAPMNIWDYANWDGTGDFGTGNSVDCFLSVTDTTYLNSPNTWRFCCDLVPNAGDFVFTGPLQFYSFKPGSAENSTVSVLKKSGDWNVVTYGMYIGNASGTKATFVNESGNITSTGTSKGVHIGCVAGATGIVENVSGDWTIEGDMFLAETSDTAATFVNESGNVTVKNINFGTFNAASGTGTLTIKGGTVTVANDAKFLHGEGTINLDGGTLVTKRIQRYGQNGSLSQNINFNGGTLKASMAATLILSQYGDMYVTVNAGGGTIDCNGYAITLDTDTSNPYNHANGFRGDGGLTFTGGNTITLNQKVTYTGATRITPGTTLAITDADAKDNILSNGLVVASVPTEEQAKQSIFTYTSAMDDDDLDNVSCPLAPTTTFKFGDENKTNIVVDVLGTELYANYWTGEAGDNNLSTLGNWSANIVPTDNAVIFSAGPVTLTKGADFAPSSITFADGSAPVTIDGDFTTLTSITNNSSLNQTFAGFVDFGVGNIDVTATAALSGTEPNQTVVGGCVVFKGGVTGAKVANHSIVAGNYTLTTDEAFTATDTTDRFTINENSSLSVKNAGNTCALYIREGATFNVENASPTSGGSLDANNCLWSWSKGAYVVSNLTHSSSRGSCLGGHTFSSAYGAANVGSVLKIGTHTLNNDQYLTLHGTGHNSGGSIPTIFIGEGGLNITSGKAGYYVVKSDIHKTTLRPWNSDFTFGSGSSKDYDFLLGEGDNTYHHTENIKFTLNTDDEAGVPRTVTMAARICTSTNTSSITVAGHGTNVVTSASPLMTGTYKLTDTATVVLKNGAAFTNGTVSVGSAATLAVGESGTVKSGNLTLADGAALAFNWTVPATAPVLDLTGKTVTVDGAVKVKVSAAEGIERPESGTFVLTSGGGFAGKTVELAADKPRWAKGVSVNGDGNIVVEVKPKGFALIFR